MKTVLVPLDGTPSAEAALPALQSLCDPGDSIVLLSVQHFDPPVQVRSRPGASVTGVINIPSGPVTNFDLPDVPVYDETRDQAISREFDEARQYLDGLAGRLRAAGFQVSGELVDSSNAAEEIIAYARKLTPAFIVMLRRNKRGLRDRALGSVASRVVMSDVAPVVLVPPQSA